MIPDRITWAVSQLQVRATDRLLEIGCGPGHAIGLLCPRLSRGKIVGIDRSALQVQRSRANNKACVAAGRARIEQAALVDAPALLDEGPFRAAFAINVNAFWTDPSPNLASLTGLMVRGGLVYLLYEPPSASGARRLEALLLQLLPSHGFAVDDVRTEALGTGRGLCIIGRPSRVSRRVS